MSRAPVTVVIPAFNAAAYLAESIQSVRRQPVQPAEIIVVDDGSTDRTPEIAASLTDIVCLRQGNSGPSAARNRGIAAATQEFVAFLDADDLWPEGSLAVRLSAMNGSRRLDAVLGRTRAFERLESGRPAEDNAAQIAPMLGAALFRRSLFAEIGEFDPTLRSAEDHDFFLRLREAGRPFVVLPQVTLWYRRHPGSVTFGRPWWNRDFFRMLKNSLDRRTALSPGDPRPVPRLSDLARSEDEDVAPS